MTLNASGPISLGGSTTGQSINLELGQSATAQVSLNDSNVRTLAGVASGAIVMPTNFYGKSAAVVGQATYTTAGNYTWVCPTGVTSVSFVVVSSGGAGYEGGRCTCPCCYWVWGGGGGGGGGLGYANNYPVSAGNSYTVIVSDPTINSGISYFANASTYGVIGGSWASYDNAGMSGRAYQVTANGFTGWMQGGRGGAGSYMPNFKTAAVSHGAGGGGAAGYSNIKDTASYGNGADGATANATNGAYGGGGGGGWGNGSSSIGAGGGGGVGYLGQGSSGSAGAAQGIGGGGGSGGANGTTATSTVGASGGAYGGGGGGGSRFAGGAAGTVGFIRIIWPGTTRYYPNTQTGDL